MSDKIKIPFVLVIAAAWLVIGQTAWTIGTYSISAGDGDDISGNAFTEFRNVKPEPQERTLSRTNNRDAGVYFFNLPAMGIGSIR